jgi:hypothetical protein
MKVKILIAPFVIIILIIAALISISLYQPYEPKKEFVKKMEFEKSEDLLFKYETTKYPSSVAIFPNVDANMVIGFTVDPWNLDFGIIPTGGNFGKRGLILTNVENKEAKIKLNVYGNITPMVSFSKNDFILNKDENATISVFMKTTNTTEVGNYTGEIDVVVSRPKYEIFGDFLW